MTYTATYPFRRHQRKALDFVLPEIRATGSAGLQVPMRAGKTKTTVDLMNILHEAEGIERVLVVCPVSGLGVWPSEIEKHTPEGTELTWKIVNYEMLYDRKKRGHPRREWLEYAPDAVILDEAHRIGNPTTVSGKAVCRLGERARFRFILTGTMFHRKPFYVFGQMKFLDPSIFGGSWSNFKRQVAVFGGYKGYEVVEYQNLEWMMEHVKRKVFIHKPLTEVEAIHRVVPVKLTGRVAGMTRDIENRKKGVAVYEGHEVAPDLPITRHRVLQQLAAGWIRDDNGTPVRVPSDHRDVGKDLLLTYMDEGIPKVVIGCWFLPELGDAAKAAKAAGYQVSFIHGTVPKEKRPQIRDWFTNQEEPTALVCQIAAAAESVDLSAADTMLFWNLSENYTAHDQFSRRIERYRDDRVLQYDYLIPTGSRIEVAYTALSLKKDVSELLADDPAEVEEITRRV